MALSATIASSITATLSQDSTLAITTDVVASGSSSFPTLTQTLTDGTGAGQATKWYRSYRTLATVTSENLDLSGSLLDPFGATLSFTGIKAIVVAVVAPDGTKSVTIGGAASNPFIGPFSAGGTLNIPYNQVLINPNAAGWGVTAATADILKVYNPGASTITYCIWIVGI